MGRVDVIPVPLENVFGLVLLTLLLSLGSCTGSSLLPIEDLLVLYLCYGLPFRVSFHICLSHSPSYLLCLPPFLNFAVNNRQQAELVSLVFSTLVTIFSNSHFPPRCLGSLGTVVIARKKKVVSFFFFTHTHFSARSWLCLSPWTFCSVWGGLYLWCVTRSCAYCIFYKRDYI